MTLAEEYTSRSAGNVAMIVQTGVAGEDALASTPANAGRERERWGAVIETLSRWRENADDLRDDGIVPPTPQLIDRACDFASAYREDRPAPTHVAPTGDGGIVFEQGAPSLYYVLTFHPDGAIEETTFSNFQLVYRECIPGR